MESGPLTVAVVGGGNSAHVLVNLLTRSKINTILITRRPNEWTDYGVDMCYTPTDKCFNGEFFKVTNDYKHVKSANVVFICSPVHVQIEILSNLAPFISKNTLVGTIFGQARFDKMVDFTIGYGYPCFAFVQIP